MSENAKKLAAPPLRDFWSAAKKKAEEEVKKEAKKTGGDKKALDKFTALDKKFDQDFGPALEKWAAHYPDLTKLTDARAKLVTTIEKYNPLVDNAGLPKDAAAILKQALTSLKKELDTRLEKARQYVAEDKNPTAAAAPFKLLDHQLKEVVKAKGGGWTDVLELVDLHVVATVTDPVVLRAAGVRDVEALKKLLLADAGLDAFHADVVTALTAAAAKAKANHLDLPTAEAEFKRGVGEAVKHVLARASAAVQKHLFVPATDRSYQVNVERNWIRLTGRAAAVAASGRVLTALTGGAKDVLEKIAEVKALGPPVQELVGLVSGVRQQSARVAAELKVLRDLAAAAEAAGPKDAFETTPISSSPAFVTAARQFKATFATLDTTFAPLHAKADALHRASRVMNDPMTELVDDMGEAYDETAAADLKLFDPVYDAIADAAKEVSALSEQAWELLHFVLNVGNGLERLAKEVPELSADKTTWGSARRIITFEMGRAKFGSPREVDDTESGWAAAPLFAAKIEERRAAVAKLLDAARTALPPLLTAVKAKATL